MLFTAHLTRLAAGLPALALVIVALRKSRETLHPFVWGLALVTAGAPLAAGYVWAWNPMAGVFYVLLTYGAAFGFAVRLVSHRLPYRLHWPLLILFVTSAVTAFIAIPEVVVPAMRTSSIADDFSDSSPDSQVQQSLVDIGLSLTHMRAEQQRLENALRSVMEHVKVRAARVRELENRRADVMRELLIAKKLKGLTDEEIERLRKTRWTDNVVSFVVGLASSVTAAFALKLFLSSN